MRRIFLVGVPKVLALDRKATVDFPVPPDTFFWYSRHHTPQCQSSVSPPLGVTLWQA